MSASWRYLLTLIGVLVFVTPAQARRVALVIGNSAYSDAGRLANAVNDAADVSAALRQLSFDVTLESDLTTGRFEAVITAFVSKAQGADAALFYFAGHAVQLGAVNYLMPTDARLSSELAVKREAISAQDIVEHLEGSARMTLVFLDACRNNPLADRLKSALQTNGRSAAVGRGLATFSGRGRDTLIVFSAEPGQIAADGVAGSRNSPFAASLLRHIATAGVEIESMLKRVARDVQASTRNAQLPERVSKLQSEFYFREVLAPAQVSASRDEPAPTRFDAIAALSPGAGLTAWAKDRLLSGEPCNMCPEMVVVPARSFIFGSPIGEPKRQQDREFKPISIIVPQPFAIGRAAITVAEYEVFVQETRHDVGTSCDIWDGKTLKVATGYNVFRPNYRLQPQLPATCVSWHDAQAYTRWLSAKTGQAYRLPSEVEREYATRAGSEAAFTWGTNQINDTQANYDAMHRYNGGAVGRFRNIPIGATELKPNAWGLFHVHGNVNDWTGDCAVGPEVLPTGTKAVETGDCTSRILKGGSWLDEPELVRSGSRNFIVPAARHVAIGFRVVRDIPR